MTDKEMEQLAINTIRTLSMDVVQAENQSNLAFWFLKTPQTLQVSIFFIQITSSESSSKIIVPP